MSGQPPPLVACTRGGRTCALPAGEPSLPACFISLPRAPAPVVAVEEYARAVGSLESRSSSAEARADSLAASLASKTRELQECEQRYEVEKRVLLDTIRALEEKGSTASSKLSGAASELGTLRLQVTSLVEERDSLARSLDAARQHEDALVEQVRAASQLAR
jgi:hypothetical protein